MAIGLAGEPSPGIGGMHGGCFMAGMHKVDRSADGSVEQRHNVVAGEREDRLVAITFECAHYEVGAAEGLGHRVWFSFGQGQGQDRAIRNSWPEAGYSAPCIGVRAAR